MPGQDRKHLHSMTGQVGHFFAFNDLSRLLPWSEPPPEPKRL
jgi:hypothetical protein